MAECQGVELFLRGSFKNVLGNASASPVSREINDSGAPAA
jgi:hypothetical protein